MPPHYIPPILRIKGLRLISCGVTDEGIPFLLFAATRGKIREVTIYVRTKEPATLVYGYVVRDQATQTETTYHGPFGDPTKDTVGPLEGFA